VTRWLDEEEMAAWRGLAETFSDLTAVLEDELLATHGLNLGEYLVMVQLSEQPDHRLRMCDLATRLHLSPSGLTRRLEHMVREGYVKREPDTADRRVINAVLTDEGYARLVEAAPTHVEGVRTHLLDHLSRAQIRQLGSVLRALARSSAEPQV